jgi:hypothetical protein
MSNRLLILPAALLILGTVLVVARNRGVERRSPSTEDSPEACIARLLTAEKSGDSRAYLDCFALSQKKKLEMVWQGQSQSQIAVDLCNQSAGLLGQAVTDVKFTDSDHAGLVLERIHKDYALRQDVELARDGGRWRITGLSAPERQTPAVPYGTPVFTPR